MAVTKKEAIKLIKNLPDDFSWEYLQDILYKLYVVKNVERGLKDVEEGPVIPHEEIKKKYVK